MCTERSAKTPVMPLEAAWCVPLQHGCAEVREMEQAPAHEPFGALHTLRENLLGSFFHILQSRLRSARFEYLTIEKEFNDVEYVCAWCLTNSSRHIAVHTVNRSLMSAGHSLYRWRSRVVGI
jgi:hypothetical protein